MDRSKLKRWIKNYKYDKIDALVESGVRYDVKDVFFLLLNVYDGGYPDKEMVESISRLIEVNSTWPLLSLATSYFHGYKVDNPARIKIALYLTRPLLRRPITKKYGLASNSIHQITFEGNLDHFRMALMYVEEGVELYDNNNFITNIFYYGDLDTIKKVNEITPIRFDFVNNNNTTLLESWISSNLRRGEDPKEGILYILKHGAPIKGSIIPAYSRFEHSYNIGYNQTALNTMQFLQALGESIPNDNTYDQLIEELEESMDHFDAGEIDDNVMEGELYKLILYKEFIKHYSTASLKSIALTTIELNCGDLSLLPRSYYYQRPPFPLINEKRINKIFSAEFQRLTSG